MRSAIAIFFGVAVLALSVALVSAQTVGAQKSAPITGYLDVSTGIFTALPPASPVPNASSTPVVRAGTIKVQAAIKLDPSISKSALVMAFVVASVNDTVYSDSVGTRVMAARSGSTATLSVGLPYLFEILSSSEKMTIHVSLATQTGDFPFAQFSQSIAIPASNATTTVKFPASL